jgi:flagellin
MRINTNIASLNAQAQAEQTNKNLTSSLEKLSSGLRINKAADDASGMAIADKLRTQASSIGQGISNANSGSALITIADKALSEQSSILDTVKTKLLQASTSTTSDEGREAIRKDIQKLLQQVDNISQQTTYNGINLLNEKGTDFSFQVGEKATDVIGMTTAYAVNTNGLGSAGNEGSSQATITTTASSLSFTMEGEVANVKASMTSTAGSVSITAGSTDPHATVLVSANNVSGFTASGSMTLVTTDADTIAFLNKEANFSSSDGLTKIADGQYTLTNTGGAFSFQNNALFDFTDLKVTGINANESVGITTTEKVSLEKTEGTQDLTVSGGKTMTVDGDTAAGIGMTAASAVLVQEGTVAIKADDPTTNKYVALNTSTAATASQSGELTFTIGSSDTVKSLTLSNSSGGGSVTLSTTDGTTAQALEDAGLSKNADGTFTFTNTSTSSNTLDFGSTGIVISNLTISDATRSTAGSDRIYVETAGDVTVQNDKSDSAKLDALNFSVSVSSGSSFGSSATAGFSADTVSSGLGSSNLSGLLSLGEGGLTADTAKNFMSVVDDAMTQLNSVRSDFGSTQNQLGVAISNMTTTQVNVKNAESVIRDVDYASESANFNKQNIISQAGTYALSQANAIQQNVLRLLQ